MSDPTALRAEARASSMTARTCRQAADDIERRRLLLGQRIEPVMAHHIAEVWNSHAADVSRDVLSRKVAPALWFLGLDLADTVRRLRDEVGELEARADRLLEAAFEAEAAALEPEAIGGPTSIDGGAFDPPIGSSLSTPDAR